MCFLNFLVCYISFLVKLFVCAGPVPPGGRTLFRYPTSHDNKCLIPLYSLILVDVSKINEIVSFLFSKQAGLPFCLIDENGIPLLTNWLTYLVPSEMVSFSDARTILSRQRRRYHCS